MYETNFKWEDINLFKACKAIGKDSGQSKKFLRYVLTLIAIVFGYVIASQFLAEYLGKFVNWLFLILIVLLIWNHMRRYQETIQTDILNSKFRSGLIHNVIDDVGVHQKNEYFEQSYKWGAIIDVCTLPDTVILKLSSFECVCIPESGYPDGMNQQQVVELLKSYLPKVSE